MNIETVTIGELGLGTQGWYGTSEPDQKKFSPPAWTGGPKEKPKDGFFTSTIEQHTTSWIEVVMKTRRNHEPRSLWEMTPDPQARLVIIESLEDYRRMASAFPQSWGKDAKNPGIHVNWYELSRAPQRIDGVHVISSVAQSYLKRWEVESTLWLSWRFVEWRMVTI